MSDDPTEIKPAQSAYYNPYEPINPYYGGIPIPPPPPPPPSRKKRWQVPLVFYIIVAILLILAAAGSFTLGKLNLTAISHSSTPTQQPSPTLHPTTPSHNTPIDLYAQDFNSFYGAFTQAMTTGKYDIGSTISSAYTLSCDASPTPPCTYDWLNTYHMLSGGHLGFSFPYIATYTNDSCKNIPYPVMAFTYTVVQYTQDGVINAPTHGDAVLVFSLSYIGENTSQWHWEGVILQSSC